jgi:resuscitation-promoting factor RpfB
VDSALIERGETQDGPDTRATRRAGSRRRTRKQKPSVKARLIQGTVLVALIGGVTAYVSFNKTVTLAVDGSPEHLHTFATTVAGFLNAEGIHTGSHDIVAPAPNAALTSGDYVAVRYGRHVDVTVNGAGKNLWMTATNVSQALDELGVRQDGAELSVPAATPISRQGITFTVWTQRQVTFLVDGTTKSVTTHAATVQDALTQAGITLKGQDTVSAPLTSVPTDGESISVLRISGTTATTQRSIPYPVTKVSDSTLFSGQQQVVTPGQDGVETIVLAYQTINGVKQAPKQISATITKQPVAEVVHVGTKTYPTNLSGAGQLDWPKLANCESGGNPASVDSSGLYYGLYQFSISTWDSLGGTGLPNAASSAEQTYRAELLYLRSGSGQWPVCGHFLYQ